MSHELSNPSKAKLKYFPQKVVPKCQCCEECKEAAQKQLNTLTDILAEHKVLLERIAAQNVVATNIMAIFPVNTDEQLKQLNAILATQGDPYIRQIKLLFAGNAERNLHLVLGENIIMGYNVDGSFGKKGLRSFGNVLQAMIDSISSFSDNPDKTLRSAFQRQKKKFFKQSSRTRTKNRELFLKGDDSSDSSVKP